jgi:hypothetical protein
MLRVHNSLLRYKYDFVGLPLVPRASSISRDVLCAMQYFRLDKLHHYPSQAQAYSMFAQLAVGYSLQLEIYSLWSFTDST